MTTDQKYLVAQAEALENAVELLREAERTLCHPDYGVSDRDGTANRINRFFIKYLSDINAQAMTPKPEGEAEPVAWDKFPSYLIDKCEGNVISEEFLQHAVEAMMADPQYSIHPPIASPVEVQGVGEPDLNAKRARKIAFMDALETYLKKRDIVFKGINKYAMLQILNECYADMEKVFSDAKN